MFSLSCSSPYDAEDKPKDEPKEARHWPYVGHNWPQDEAKMAQDGPLMGPSRLQGGSLQAGPLALQAGPLALQAGPPSLQSGPRSLQAGPRSLQAGPAPLKLTLVGKMMLRCVKMPFRGQLDPNMTPTWPSLGPPEGQSDL